MDDSKEVIMVMSGLHDTPFSCCMGPIHPHTACPAIQPYNRCMGYTTAIQRTHMLTRCVYAIQPYTIHHTAPYSHTPYSQPSGFMEGMGVGEFSVAHLNVSCPRGQLSSWSRFDVQRISGRQDCRAVGRDGAPRVTPVAVHGFRRWLPYCPSASTFGSVPRNVRKRALFMGDHGRSTLGHVAAKKSRGYYCPPVLECLSAKRKGFFKLACKFKETFSFQRSLLRK